MTLSLQSGNEFGMREEDDQFAYGRTYSYSNASGEDQGNQAYV